MNQPERMSIAQFRASTQGRANIGRQKVKAREKPNDFKSNLERDFNEHLTSRLFAGEILWFAYEPFKLRLGNTAFYTPDFFVVETDRTFTVYEIKGSWSAPNQAKSRVKLKSAAHTYWMFRFVAVTRRRKRDGGGWVFEEILA